MPLHFIQTALASGLISSEQVEAAQEEVAAFPPPVSYVCEDLTKRSEAEKLADQLIEKKVLNTWQATQLLAGKKRFKLGPYPIIDAIGQGGMGHVFKAIDPTTGEEVAIKVLPKAKSTPEAIATFQREIMNHRSLDHPRLVKAIDSGHDGNVYFLVCEFVPGCDLRKVIRANGPLPVQQAAKIIGHVAQGLHYAHSQGIVHRDVKPGNVLVTPEGDAKLSDLGLAGSTDEDYDDPKANKVVGTPDYLAPDCVLDPSSPVPAWDIYSLGCTLYYAVTGKVPFPAGTTSEKARAHVYLQPLDPRSINPELPAAFVDLISWMMAKKPEERVGSAEEFLRYLRPWWDDQLDTPSGETIPTARLAPVSPDEFDDQATPDAIPDVFGGENVTSSPPLAVPMAQVVSLKFPWATVAVSALLGVAIFAVVMLAARFIG